ncbi:glycosyltransferase family 2 protein [Subsaxibacter sp. CAU 1640]|uniref:glycosyltransferase family 2 protein n=1 Tax=Subsaxibacter sp. CAU 1640 TaxID=2933271 RepID=UPI0020069B9E|nr:glycosyltransferase family 2 protein [Subsaxibacter sp. CAU 1640]MCK7590234.1 glycosyltransferase family 2 protein [Subsaxibacter sp. CAU 1640]
MNQKPLVSVLMTVYNREKYIAQAIESVMASTYEQWELLIVDDRSKDTSVAIAKDYASRDARIKVYVNEQNLGDYPNRNQAASYAQGKYLKYVDADDMIYEHTLEYMVKMMERYPSAAWGTFSFKQNPKKPHPYVIKPEEQFAGQYLNGQGYFLRSPLSIIIKTETFVKLGGFIERKMVGDFEMWHKLGSSYDLLVMPHSHGFVWYRTHEGQQSSEINKFEGEYREISINYINSDHSPLSESDRILALKGLRKRYLMRVFKLITKFKFSQLRHV